MAGFNRKAVIVLFVAVCAGHLALADDYQAEIDKIKGEFGNGGMPDIASLNSSLPIQQILDTLKKKCNDASGSDAAFEEVQQGATAAQECLSPLLDWSVMMEEIEKAKPTGDLETVFNKYCRRRDTALECVKNFTATTTACLSDSEMVHLRMFEKMLEQLLGFVCHKDGDQIALFIAEKGPECFQEKKDEMWRCVNETFGSKISDFLGRPLPSLSADSLNDVKVDEVKVPEKVPDLKIEKEECKQMDEVTTCMAKVLEQCEETTPANLFESAVKFIRNESPCKNHPTAKELQKKNGAKAVAMEATLVAMTGVLAVVRQLAEGY